MQLQKRFHPIVHTSPTTTRTKTSRQSNQTDSLLVEKGLKLQPYTTKSKYVNSFYQQIMQY